MKAPSPFVHEAAIYGTDDELLSVAVPFLEAGAEAGEPTVLAVGAREQELVRAAVGEMLLSAVTVVGGDHYADPFRVLRAHHETVTGHVAAGASRIRLLGQFKETAMNEEWHRWARYEVACNRLFSSLPVWAICAYDTRIAPANVIDEAKAIHPYLATATSGVPGRQTSSDYCEHPSFLTGYGRALPDPLEAGAPDIELTGPTPAAARHAVVVLATGDANVGGTSSGGANVGDALALAVSEVVTNASIHGRPPVVLRAWRDAVRVLVTVSDRGSGPSDALAGMLPPGEHTGSGLGLWITHHVCGSVNPSYEEDGFTVRLVFSVPAV